MYHQYQQKDQPENKPLSQQHQPLNGPTKKSQPASVPNSPSPMPNSAPSSNSPRRRKSPNFDSSETLRIGGSESAGSDSLSSVTIQNLNAPMGVEENSNGEFSDDQLLGEDAAQRENLKDYGLFGPMQLARAHWIQLHKTNMQLPILKRMFLQLLQSHPQLRALWPFAQTFDGSAPRLDQLVRGSCFRHFCQSYQASLTMCFDVLDDEPTLSRLLQELGSNHFFYDCIEPHFRLMRDEFLNALVDCLAGSSEELDEALAADWDLFWAKLEANMCFGLKVQRHNYLAHCITGSEIEALREQWHRLVASAGGIGPLGERIGNRGKEAFLKTMAAIGQVDRSGEGEKKVEAKQSLNAAFLKCNQELLWTIEKALNLWEPGTGFLRLCAEIDGKSATTSQSITKFSAPLIRRPFIEAFGDDLAQEFGEQTEPKKLDFGSVRTNSGKSVATMHSWSKMYRVAEQAIIADGLDRKNGNIK